MVIFLGVNVYIEILEKNFRFRYITKNQIIFFYPITIITIKNLNVNDSVGAILTLPLFDEILIGGLFILWST